VFSSIFMMDIYAQKAKAKEKTGHELIFNIKDASDEIVYLAIHYREKLILKDSTAPVAKGKYIFKGSNLYDDGLYTLVSQKRYPYLNFIIDRNQQFEYSLDTTGNVEHIIIKNSPENEEMLAFQKKTMESQKKMQEWQKKRSEFETAGNSDSATYYLTKMNNLNDGMLDFIQSLINRNPNYLFSKMQKAYMNIEVPEIKNEDGTLNTEAQAAYYRSHYWDNIDLSDHRFIFLPVFEPKVKEYFTKILWYQETDTINKYIDMVLAKTETDSLMFRYFVDWLSYQFETSKIIGHDAIFVHLAKNNQLKGKCPWMDEDLIRKYEKRVSRIEPLLIGKQSVELIIPDTSQTDDFTKWHSSYKMPKKYVILWFYDPDCPTCKKESANLRILYDSLETAGTRNFDVYGIGNDADIDRWKKYVKDQNYPWLNVGGNKANVDYLETYNIYESGNPTMFILNEKREIILNKRIDMFSIPEFLQQYEKIEANKRARENK
ncbi:MAG: DUF5106 domain-containing protein, partial [Bacteroidales bacterium]